ncbi:MAG: hypothetical protein IH626_16980 [Rhodospirillales bacterium]|nr:hypothetical protein [Rhodospirillales bacterium]
MRRAFLVVLGLQFVAGPALAEDNVKMSCSEYARLTGNNLCDMMPEVKLTKADHDKLMRADKKKKCLAVLEQKYGHCPNFHSFWTAKDDPPECIGHTEAECDQPDGKPKPQIEKSAGRLWE